MEIRIYDADLNFMGLIENQTSLLWTRKYFETGTFELHCPITDFNRKLVKLGCLVWKKEATEAGVIEDIKLTENSTSNEITAKGRFLESYMDRRLIRPLYNISAGLVETAMREILSNAVAIPNVQLGTVQGYTETVTFQAAYKNLLSYEIKLSKSSNIGFRFRPDFTAKTITFELYKGLDRSISQADRNRVIFSDSYNNINDASYSKNDQLQKTVCYVGGSGEGTAKIYVTAGDDTLAGLERRETYIDASDVTSDDITDAEYKAALVQRGQTELDADALSESFECTTEADSNFKYKSGYDLGDIVTLQKKGWGVSEDLRITEITETYENGAMTVSPTLGTPLPETIDWQENS